MIKRTLYFGSNCYIHTKKEQLQAVFPKDPTKNATVPIEDVGVVILDSPQMTISRALLSKFLFYNVAVVICNEKHMPTGLLLNLDANTIQQKLYAHQIKASEALKNNLWQQTVKAKITNQALLLDAIGDNGKKLHYWAAGIKTGDPQNTEGTAAAYYWRHVFIKAYKNTEGASPYNMVKNFKRERFGSAPNSLFNYGYAILRAVVARNLAASGLLPTFGIHHHNKYNAYALADDIMEPYRPYVDFLVREITEKLDFKWKVNGLPLKPNIKRLLLQIPTIDVIINGKTHPLMIGVRRTTASLADCFAKKKKKIAYPEFTNPTARLAPLLKGGGYE